MSIFSKILPPALRWYIREFHAARDRSRRSEATIIHLEAAIDVLLGVPTDFEALAFNGQNGRQAIFAELLSALDVRLIVETGTYTGITTGFMARSSGLPVISCEVNPRFHAVAKLRLKDVGGARLENVDSRRLLRQLAAEKANTETPTFFYLDAHWYGDFPLLEEIAIVAENWGRFVIMVDDFQVVGDPGYSYDDYGGGEALTPEYIEAAVKRYDLSAFFPSMPSSEEAGRRRGCVVLVGRDLVGKVEAVKSLRRCSTY